mgnify:CR=1 FL=1
MDYGAKGNILRELVNNDCRLTIFPATTKAEDVLAINPDGIFLSNGPGDPKDIPDIIDNVKQLMGKKPIFGICLGLQLIGLALGGKSRKLTFGHRGSNHPVKDIRTGRVYITSQNHGYIIDEDSLPKDEVVITHRNSMTTPLKVLKFRPAISCASSTIRKPRRDRRTICICLHNSSR